MKIYKGKLSGVCYRCGDKIINIPIWMRDLTTNRKGKRFAICKRCYVDRWIKKQL